MNHFWPDSGYSLLKRTRDGRLAVTDDYLRRYYRRPELAPVPESCAAERALNAALLAAPQRTVTEADLAAIADADARDNYRVMLRFRDRLLAHETLESFYAALFRDDIAVPPDFIHQTVQDVVRGLLDGATDALDARAAELFFREQRATVENGTVLLADALTVHAYRDDGGLGAIGRLLREVEAPLRPAQLDVLGAERNDDYWARSGRYDTVLALGPESPGAAALGRVMERWIAHFHGVACTVSSIREIPDDEWVWHVGLDAEATALLNAVYRGDSVDGGALGRVIGLFRADFAERAALRPEVAGAPVFMALAMRPDGGVRFKPQNLLLNLPLARPA